MQCPTPKNKTHQYNTIEEEEERVEITETNLGEEEEERTL